MGLERFGAGDDGIFTRKDGFRLAGSNDPTAEASSSACSQKTDEEATS